MPPPWQKNDDEQEQEEEEEELDENSWISQKDAVLFAIEVSESMIKVPDPPKDGKKAETDSPASAALKCAYKFMQDRIISNPKDMMGILLFGTEQTKLDEETSRGGLSFPHCYLLADLDIPDAATVKRVKKLVEDENRTEAQVLLKPSKEPVTMNNLLFCANQAFTTKAPNFGSRRLFIITDNDNPHGDDKNLRNTATVRAKDLYDLGVIIELFPISKPGQEFDRTAFYDDILYADPNPDALSVSSTPVKNKAGTDGMNLLTSLISSVKSKQIPKRALFSGLPFEIGPNLQISVKGYNVLSRQKPARSHYIWEDGEKSQIVKTVSDTIREDNLHPLPKFENYDSKTRKEKKKELIKKAFKFASTYVHITEKEVNDQLKNFGGKILRIIGFKPEKMLPQWASISKSTFIYPSEDEVVGSTRVFAALHQKLLKDKLIGLAWYVPRANAMPTIVAIIPSVEQFSKTGQQIVPAGLWLHILPFADDLRPLPTLAPPIKADQDLVDEMALCIKQLQLPGGRFDPTEYPNPALQWHYKIIQAMALEEELPEHPEDKTIPRYRQIDKRVAGHIADWSALLEEKMVEYARNRPEPLTKKRVAAVADGGEKKRVKKEKPDADGDSFSVADMKIIVEQDKVSKLTVKQLRDFLKSRGLADTGLKNVLVERVEEFFE